MNTKHSALARKQLDRRLTPLRELNVLRPPKGWARAIREALGMTMRQLATRMDVAPSRIAAIETAEVNDATTLKTLRETAAAMNCTFVYAFVPAEPLEEIFNARVWQKSGEEMARLNHTMQLENQALKTEDLNSQRQTLFEKLRVESPRGLWDDGQN